MENEWANDTDRFALAAHPGKSQGPPPKTTGSKPIVRKRRARLRSPCCGSPRGVIVVSKVQCVQRWTGRAIGLDLHRDFCEIAICEEGQTYGAGRVAMTAEGIEALADSLLPTDRVVMEVSSGAREVARRLEGRCQRVVVVTPDDTGIAQARAKTDKPDCRTLASLLWRGSLRRCGRRMSACGCSAGGFIVASSWCAPARARRTRCTAC